MRACRIQQQRPHPDAAAAQERAGEQRITAVVAGSDQ
jgi:hypothetical protein